METVSDIARIRAATCGPLPPAPLPLTWWGQEFWEALKQHSQGSRLSLGVAQALHAPPSGHRAPLCPAEPTVTQGSLGALKGEMPELLSVLFCRGECSSPLLSWTPWRVSIDFAMMIIAIMTAKNYQTLVTMCQVLF